METEIRPQHELGRLMLSSVHVDSTTSLKPANSRQPRASQRGCPAVLRHPTGTQPSIWGRPPLPFFHCPCLSVSADLLPTRRKLFWPAGSRKFTLFAVTADAAVSLWRDPMPMSVILWPPAAQAAIQVGRCQFKRMRYTFCGNAVLAVLTSVCVGSKGKRSD